MVNISTNINKTKESLNSDGQQLYQYQQNERNQLSYNISKTTTCVVGYPGPGLRQALKCDGIKVVNGIPTH